MSDVGMTEEQKYLFDTFGYLIVRDAVSQDQIQELRNTMRGPTEQWEPVDQSEGPLHWHSIWRELLDLPTLTPILEEIIGNHDVRHGRERAGRPYLPTFRIDHINIHSHVQKGFPGGHLHGGWKGTGGCQFSSYHDGHFYNGLISVSFELYNTFPNDGGFACIPGSHKSNLRLPGHWRNLADGMPECVTRVPATPGDAIIFTEALTHGTLPWTSDAKRTTVFYKYSPHGSTWSADYFNPDDFEVYSDMDDRKLAILEPPNARYRGRPTTPRVLQEYKN